MDQDDPVRPVRGRAAARERGRGRERGRSARWLWASVAGAAALLLAAFLVTGSGGSHELEGARYGAGPRAVDERGAPSPPGAPRPSQREVAATDEAPTGYALEGRVSSAAGEPLAATIELSTRSGHCLVRTQSGEDGRYRVVLGLEERGAVLVFRRPGFQTRRFGLPVEALEAPEREASSELPVRRLPVVLRPGIDLALALRWDDGSPCAGAEVTLDLPGDPESAEVNWRGGRERTTSAGRAQFRGLPAEGLAAVLVSPAGYPSWFRTSLALGAAGPGEVGVVVPRPCSLRVSLVGTEGLLDPGEEALLRIKALDRSSPFALRPFWPVSSEHPSAVLCGLRVGGLHQLALVLPGREPQVVAGALRLESCLQELELDVSGLRFESASTVVAAPPRILTCRFETEEGEPATLRDLIEAGLGPMSLGAACVSWDGRESRVPLRHEAQGEDGLLVGALSAPGAPPFSVALFADGLEIGRFEGVTGESPLAVRLPPVRGSRRPLVVCGALDGAPLPLVRGHFQLQGAREAVAAAADSSGELQLQLRPARYSFHVVAANGYELEGELDAGRGPRHAVDFHAAGGISGRIEAEGGRQLAVQVSPAGIPEGVTAVASRPVPVDADGAFEVQNLQPGSYSLSVLDLGSGADGLAVGIRTREVRVRAGTVERYSFRLDAEQQGEVVLGIDGAPAAMVRLETLAGTALFQGQVPSGSRFRMPLGSYRIAAHPLVTTSGQTGPDTDRMEVVDVDVDVADRRTLARLHFEQTW